MMIDDGLTQYKSIRTALPTVADETDTVVLSYNLSLATNDQYIS
jgi:hypothetical protein